jgi:hypothetical protein
MDLRSINLGTHKKYKDGIFTNFALKYGNFTNFRSFT